MHKNVRKYYEPRPDIFKNSADSKPVDDALADILRITERRLGFICTEQAVSATIDDNE